MNPQPIHSIDSTTNIDEAKENLEKLQSDVLALQQESREQHKIIVGFKECIDKLQADVLVLQQENREYHDLVDEHNDDIDRLTEVTQTMGELVMKLAKQSSKNRKIK